MKIIIALVVGLLLGYIVYPFINPSQQPAQKPEAPPGESKAVAREGWKTFEDKAYGISFEYPSEWTINRESQIFEQGDLVDVYKIGETQKEQTEFYDGARLVVMIPEETTLDLAAWVADKHQGMPGETPPQVTDVQINGRAFKKVDECGLGCFSYYYTLVSGKVYGVMTSAAGPQKAELEATLEQMLAKLELGK